MKVYKRIWSKRKDICFEIVKRKNSKKYAVRVKVGNATHGYAGGFNSLNSAVNYARMLKRRYDYEQRRYEYAHRR